MQKSFVSILVVFSCALHIVGINCTAKKTRVAGSVDTIPAKFSPVTVSEGSGNPSNGMVDFVTPSRLVTPAVVHIKVLINPSAGGSFQSYDLPPGSRGMGSGSGVIITDNGFIVTNNHVVENAIEIQVVLPDKRVFPATVTGLDPNTDLALIKINATGLPIVKFGNSDKVEVGQWVLAVGYPFSLNTTVTAGIVSAKARSIGIIQPSGDMGAEPRAGSAAIESFIQTDAAINPGNSGGALVNTNGELIGINSAIASQTGSYAGYAFAVPANLTRKIVEDLQRYGTVKRGILGVSFPAPSTEDQFFQQKGLTPGSVKGVYITGVSPDGAAAEAGLREGDVIQSIDGFQLNSSSEFSERIARRRPGETTQITYLRDGKAATVSVVLKGEETSRTTDRTAASLQNIHDKLGASFEPLTNALKQRYNLDGGVVVTDVRRGGFFEQLGIPAGTIIAFINGKAIGSTKDIDEALLSAQRGMIQILAIAPDGSKAVYNFSLGT